MKVLLLQQSKYLPSHGGANQANRLMLEALCQNGHQCAALGPADLAYLPEDHGHQLRSEDLRTTRFVAAGVAVCAVKQRAAMMDLVAQEILEMQPDWVWVSSEDPGQLLLDMALKQAPGRVIYLAHTTLLLPFGPGGFLKSEEKTGLLARCAGILTVSQFMQSYLSEHAGLNSFVVQPPLYTRPKSPFDNHDRGRILLINPCAYKGLDIFMKLAEARPQYSFAAVPTWGTTRADRIRLGQPGNVAIWEASDRIEEIFAETRILLVPSLWHEAFGRVCVEGMLHGIPVLAANIGGLPEAKLGIPYVLPVQPINHYRARFDERNLPLAEVAEQNIEPWLQVLDELMTMPDRYRQVSQDSFRVACDYLAGLGFQALEEYMVQLKVGETGRTQASQHNQPVPSSKWAHLSPAQRALLARKLTQKQRSE